MSFPTKEQLYAQFSQADDAVYFASADKQHIYFGFGVSAEINTGDAGAIKEWMAQQDQPVFGGLPFDEQTQASPIMAGYFFAPCVVYEVTAGAIFGTPITTWPQIKRQGQATITKQVDDIEWPERIKNVIKTMQTDTTKQKVVLGRQRQLKLTSTVDQVQLLIDLNTQQPNSYHFVLKHGGEIFVSATPERLVKVDGQAFATAGVAGTTRRSINADEDEQLAMALLHDDKNLLEHEYVVNTIKERLADLVALTVPNAPSIMKNPQVQHLYTPITGHLNTNTNILDLVTQLHPTPALGGKPLAWAMATIKDIELEPRGLFAAPIGVVLPNGDGEFIVGIRAMLIKQQTAQLFAGAGILADSDAAQEFAETGLKMTPMMNLLKG